MTQMMLSHQGEKKVNTASEMVVHEMITTVEFKKQCDAGILHYGKKGQHQNRKHLETILGVGEKFEVGLVKFTSDICEGKSDDVHACLYIVISIL